VVHVPAEVPTLAAATVTARIGASAVPGKWRAELSIKGAPVALAAAVAPFRIQLHLQLDGGDWEAIPGELALVSGKLAWALERAMPGPPWPALRLAAVLIDPVRRSAPAVIVDAVAE
jgi:hypothetical protein